jgi:hypothetical protein
MPFSPSVQYYRANLNSASLDALVRVGGLDPKRAKALVQHRPYRSWDEIEQVPGFDRHVAYSLQESSYLGPSVSSKSSEESGMSQGSNPIGQDHHVK